MTRTYRLVTIIIALILMTIMLSGCGSASQSAPHDLDSTAHAPGHGAHGGVDVAAQPATEFSVYDLDAQWHDQQGLPVKLRYLAGRPRLVALVYTSCAYACPRIMKDMKRIEGELRAAGEDAGFVLISIDPERDTPPRLLEYATSTRLDPNDWTLLTGTEDAVLELAALLGVRYRRISDTDFEHSNVITLLDAEGRIVHRQVGLGADPHAILEALSRR